MWEKLSDFDKGWITGIVEGEGYIGARKTKRGATEITIEVTSTDIETVARLLRLVGGQIYGPYATKEPHHKPPYSWRLYKKELTRSLIEGIRPYLSAHRTAQADGALYFYEHRTTQRGKKIMRYTERP